MLRLTLNQITNLDIKKLKLWLSFLHVFFCWTQSFLHVYRKKLVIFTMTQLYIIGSSYYKAQINWQRKDELLKQTAIPKNVKKIIKNEECDDPSSLLLQHEAALYPPPSHSSSPPSLLLRRSFISESSDSLHGQRFTTLSTVNRRRWFRLRPSSFSGFFRFIRHRFPLPMLSPQGNATSAFEWSAKIRWSQWFQPFNPIHGMISIISVKIIWSCMLMWDIWY